MRRLRRNVIAGALVGVLLLFSLGVSALAQDADGDGMADDWEVLFGLNPAINDAAEDPDEDSLTNLAEFQLLTDPLAPDTDLDGFLDGNSTDSDPVSRGVIRWGDFRFTMGDDYSYPAPDWLLRSWKIYGDWLTNAPPEGKSAWHVAASESNGVGSLNLSVDRGILTNNLRLGLTFFAHSASELYLDLLDENGGVVLSDLAGNLNSGSEAVESALLNLPLRTYPDAVVLSLRRQSGEATVYFGAVYIDEDSDGLDDSQEVRQLGTSDYLSDTDGDGLSDYDEVFIYGTNPANPDTDGDGMKDGWEVQNGLDPKQDEADADSDGDGVSNYLEYLQGRDPQAGAVADTNAVVNLKVFTVLEL